MEGAQNFADQQDPATQPPPQQQYSQQYNEGASSHGMLNNIDTDGFFIVIDDLCYFNH